MTSERHFTDSRGSGGAPVSRAGRERLTCVCPHRTCTDAACAAPFKDKANAISTGCTSSEACSQDLSELQCPNPAMPVTTEANPAHVAMQLQRNHVNASAARSIWPLSAYIRTHGKWRASGGRPGALTTIQNAVRVASSCFMRHADP